MVGGAAAQAVTRHLPQISMGYGEMLCTSGQRHRHKFCGQSCSIVYFCGSWSVPCELPFSRSPNVQSRLFCGCGLLYLLDTFMIRISCHSPDNPQLYLPSLSLLIGVITYVLALETEPVREVVLFLYTLQQYHCLLLSVLQGQLRRSFLILPWALFTEF